MVISNKTQAQHSRKINCRGMLMTELMVAMAILCIAVMPLGYSLVQDTHWLRANYHHAVAMEIVDGEIEILATGDWRSLPEGTHPYTVHAGAAMNLPEGEFQVTRTGNQIRLQWAPAEHEGYGIIAREVTVK